MKDLLLERLKMAYEAPGTIMQVAMDKEEMIRLIDALERKGEPQETQDYMNGYEQGFQYGWARAMVDVIKTVKGMKTYGGNYKKTNAAGVPAGAAK